MSGIRIGVIGCAGRMGRMLMTVVASEKGAVLSGGAEAPGHPAIGRDLGELAGLDPLGIRATDDLSALFAASDAVLDFTVPAATIRHTALAAETGRALIIGTTGLEKTQTEAIEAAAKRAPIVWAANMSLGITLLTDLVESIARRLGPDYDIEIVEMHHRHKVDAPSGTALALGKAAAAGRGVALEDVARRARDGQVGPRPEGEIGFATLRGGDVVGDHTIIFAGAGERIELTHRATDRIILARGAVRAACWAAGKAPGLYDMKDVLDLR